jgi:hypothetical protein
LTGKKLLTMRGRVPIPLVMDQDLMRRTPPGTATGTAADSSRAATPGTERRRCGRCRAILARDNTGERCSPCWQAELLAQRGPVLRRPGDETRLRRAFGEGGVRAVARELGRSEPEALDLVLAHGLIPARQRSRVGALRALQGLEHLSHIRAAEALGLSRWTVATYRSLLGHDRHAD